jgi:hypothetical protein
MAILMDNLLFSACPGYPEGARQVPGQAENSRDDGPWMAEKDQARTTYLGISMS